MCLHAKMLKNCMCIKLLQDDNVEFFFKSPMSDMLKWPWTLSLNSSIISTLSPIHSKPSTHKKMMRIASISPSRLIAARASFMSYIVTWLIICVSTIYLWNQHHRRCMHILKCHPSIRNFFVRLFILFLDVKDHMTIVYHLMRFFIPQTKSHLIAFSVIQVDVCVAKT